MSRQVQVNVRSQVIEWRQGRYNEEGPYWEAWQPLTARGSSRQRTEIQRYWDHTFSQMVFADFIDSIVEDREVDPLKDYLEGLPKLTGRNLLPNVLATCMNVAKGYEELAKWASKYMFLGVVWRTFVARNQTRRNTRAGGRRRHR